MHPHADQQAQDASSLGPCKLEFTPCVSTQPLAEMVIDIDSDTDMQVDHMDTVHDAPDAVPDSTLDSTLNPHADQSVQDSSSLAPCKLEFSQCLSTQPPVEMVIDLDMDSMHEPFTPNDVPDAQPDPFDDGEACMMGHEPLEAMLGEVMDTDTTAASAVGDVSPANAGATPTTPTRHEADPDEDLMASDPSAGSSNAPATSEVDTTSDSSSSDSSSDSSDDDEGIDGAPLGATDQELLSHLGAADVDAAGGASGATEPSLHVRAAEDAAAKAEHARFMRFSRTKVKKSTPPEVLQRFRDAGGCRAKIQALYMDFVECSEDWSGYKLLIERRITAEKQVARGTLWCTRDELLIRYNQNATFVDSLIMNKRALGLVRQNPEVPDTEQFQASHEPCHLSVVAHAATVHSALVFPINFCLRLTRWPFGGQLDMHAHAHTLLAAHTRMHLHASELFTPCNISH